MRIKIDGQHKNVDLSAMNRDELIELRDKIQDELIGIKIQLDDVKATWAVTGEYANADWYKSAMAAKRLKGQQLQRIQTELGKKRRAGNGNLEQAFIDVARIRLHSDTFREIMNEANERVGNE